jgi:drug/metabolite transporter (DMT)-like permease
LQRDHPLRHALPLFVLSGVFFSLLDASGKFLVRDHALVLVVWARYLGQMVVATSIASHRLGSGFWRTRHLRMQLVRSLCLVGSSVSFVAALRYLPLAEGSAIAYLTPMFAILLSGPVLGEKPTRARWMASLGGFAGILILVRPGSSVFHPAAALMVLSAVSNALYQLLTRKLPNDRPETTLFYTSTVGTVVLTVLLPLAEFPAAVAPREAVLFTLLGLFAGLGHWCLIGAFTRAPASMLAPFMYLQIIWATLAGFLVFSQLPDGLSVLGMGVIVASGVTLVLHERRAALRPRLGG